MTEQQVVERQHGGSTPRILTVLILLTAAGVLGFGAGSRTRVVTEEVWCLSAEGTIGCSLGDGRDVSVPVTLSWTDSGGTFHEGGRPSCLPATGRGLEGPVRVSWTEVDVDGMHWRQVLHVACPS